MATESARIDTRPASLLRTRTNKIIKLHVNKCMIFGKIASASNHPLRFFLEYQFGFLLSFLACQYLVNLHYVDDEKLRIIIFQKKKEKNTQTLSRNNMNNDINY